MAASDARPVCRKSVAWRVYFGLRTSAGALYTPWTSQDSEVSLDGVSFADCANESTEIGSSGCGYLDLTASETNADCVVLKITTAGGLPLVMTIFPEEAGDYRADVTHISGDSSAADNLEAATDGTGYNIGGGQVVVESVTAGVTLSATTHAGAVIPTVTTLTNLPSIPTNWLTAAGIAPDALDGKGDWPSAVDVSTQVAADLTLIHGAGSWATATGFATSVALSSLVNTVGTAGAGLTAVPWNAAWDAEVQSEVADAIVAAGLPRSGVTLRYAQVASNTGAKTADVSIGPTS